MNQRTKFLLRDLHLLNKKVTRESQTFLQKILPVDAKRLCKVYLQKAFLLPPFSYRDIFPKK